MNSLDIIFIRAIVRNAESEALAECRSFSPIVP